MDWFFSVARSHTGLTTATVLAAVAVMMVVSAMFDSYRDRR